MTDPQPQQRDGLLPCPFCGCLPTDLAFSDGSTFHWLSWSCPDCGIGEEVRMQTAGNGDTASWLEAAKVKAREWWNRRNPDAELAALREEVAGLRKDAARYRALRNSKHNIRDTHDFGYLGYPFDCRDFGFRADSSTDRRLALDAALDRAIDTAKDTP